MLLILGDILGIALDFAVSVASSVPTGRRRYPSRPEKPKRPRGGHFLSAPGHRATWSDFAKEHGWTLDVEQGRLEGAFANHDAAVQLPASYLGGRTVVRLEGARPRPSLHLLPTRWWQLGHGSIEFREGDAASVSAALLTFARAHEAEIRVSGVAATGSLAECDEAAVRELLAHLALLLDGPEGYRRPRAAVDG
ncbi:MAG: hypothetical protein KC731_01635 [Myxococcales bacterium]|nr:hypothetical protein [Myxococcales bacterium]